VIRSRLLQHGGGDGGPVRPSDAQWAVIEPFMPKNQPGRERLDDRQIISGILHVITRSQSHRAGLPS
jgi:hypothetical protein